MPLVVKPISGPLTFATVAELASALDNELCAGAKLVVDLTHASPVDSAALALLLEWQRRAAQAKAHLTVQGAPRTFQRLTHLYGIEQLLSSLTEK